VSNVKRSAHRRRQERLDRRTLPNKAKTAPSRTNQKKGSRTASSHVQLQQQLDLHSAVRPSRCRIWEKTPIDQGFDSSYRSHFTRQKAESSLSWTTLRSTPLRMCIKELQDKYHAISSPWTSWSSATYSSTSLEPDNKEWDVRISEYMDEVTVIGKDVNVLIANAGKPAAQIHLTHQVQEPLRALMLVQKVHASLMHSSPRCCRKKRHPQSSAHGSCNSRITTRAARWISLTSTFKGDFSQIAWTSI
jgi:hypothetical protein